MTPNLGFKGLGTFQNRMSRNDAFCICQLQIIHLPHVSRR